MSILTGQELQTARLWLRPLRAEDADSLFEVFSDPEVTRYWNFPPWTERQQALDLIDSAEADLAARRAARLAVVRAGGARTLLGTFSLFAVDRQNRRAEIGYALRRSMWGQGYAAEAGRAVIAHAFRVLDLNRLEADIDPRNEASARVLTRLGFVQEGLLRERWIVAGSVSDSAAYGLLRRDWLASL